MDTARLALARDWDSGNYVAGSLLEDDDSLDEEVAALEDASCSLLRSANEKFDMCVGWSTGIDSLAVFHLLYQCGLTDVPFFHSGNPLYYPSNLEYAYVVPERYGFDGEFLRNDDHDFEWLAENPERRLFPEGDLWMEQIRQNFRVHADQYLTENSVDILLTGIRGEDNRTDSILRTRSFTGPGQREFQPIYNWETKHVIAYLDKYDIPVDTAYKAKPGGVGMWNRERLVDTAGNQIRTEQEMWYKVRKITVQHGYTWYWRDLILDYFPRGEEMAREYAESVGELFIPLTVGEEHGADANPVVPPSWTP